MKKNKAYQHFNSNYFIGISNGVFVELNKNLINPNLVLAAFVYSRTGSAFLVGLLTALNFVGAFLPQLYVSSLTEHRRQKKPVIMYAITMRLLLMGVLIFLIRISFINSEVWIIYLFTGCFFIYRLFRGSEFIVFWDFFGGTIPANRLGGFIATRTLFSGIVALLSGLLVIQPVLSSFPEDKSYFILSVIAFFVLLIDLIQLSFVKEQPNENPPKRRSVYETISGSAGYLKESSNYRKLLLLRIFHRLNMLTFAFLIPYAYEKIGVIGMAGVFLTVIEGSKLSSSVMWGRISNLYGNRTVLAAGNLCFFASAVVVLISSYVPELFSIKLSIFPADLDFSLLLFLLAIVFAGTAQVSNAVSYKAFVIESAPENRRSSSLAFLNTVTVPMALVAPLIGAAVEKDSSRYSWFYILLAVSGLITSFIAFSLKDARNNAFDSK